MSHDFCKAAQRWCSHWRTRSQYMPRQHNQEIGRKCVRVWFRPGAGETTSRRTIMRMRKNASFPRATIYKTAQ